MAKQFQVDTGNSLTVNLVSYYKAEDATDFYSTNDLTNNNSVVFDAGKVNNAADFGAANSSKYLSLASSLSLNTYQAGVFSVSLWYDLLTDISNPSDDDEFMYICNNAKLQIQLAYRNIGGTKKFVWAGFNGTSSETLAFTGSVTSGTFGHIVYVKNGTSVTVYVDGASLGAQTITLADLSPARTDRISIGADIQDTLYSKSKIDELGIWTKALSAQEVADLYNGGSGQTMISTDLNDYSYFM